MRHILLETPPKGPPPVIFIPPEGEDRTPEDRPPFGFSMSTIDRPGKYVHSTLASMFMGGFPTTYPLHLAVSSQDIDYLSHYRHHPNILIKPMTDEDTAITSTWHVKARATFNYWRCLSAGGSRVVFEDDVRFQNRWLGKLQKAISEIQRDGHDEYILSLYSCRDFSSKKSYFVYPTIQYDSGTVSIFYPATVVARIAEHLLQRVLYEPHEARQMSYDLLIKEWCISNGVPIFATTESLVQHIGITTAVGNVYHTSPLFRETTDEAACVDHGYSAIWYGRNTLKKSGADSLVDEVQNEVAVGNQ